MKVLIVNAFSDSPEGKRSFQRFEAAVKEAFAYQKFFNMSHIEFSVVDENSIDIYLFEYNTGYLSRDAEKLFDRLDFIFIDGNSNLLP